MVKTKRKVKGGAVPPHRTPKAPKDTKWNPTRKEINSFPDSYFAYIDPKYASGESEDKRLRKLPHHKNGKVVWRGVAAAAAVLRGARGGVDIPRKYLSGVKKHIEVHYKQFGETPPWKTKKSLLKRMLQRLLEPELQKPYQNEHSCRIREPSEFEPKSFRRIKKGKLHIIIGRLKGKTTTTTQAYRYPKKDWKKDEARRHCKQHGGRFEPAKSK